jgi:uncharacterized small protein (DUF1192 family)
MNNKDINKDYICVVKEENGYLKYCEIDIPQDDALIKEFGEMANNDELTVLDIQEKFIKAYPPNCNIYKRTTTEYPNGYYNYLYPIIYMAAYVDGVVGYPPIWTQEKYEHHIEDVENYFRSIECSSLYSKDSINVDPQKLAIINDKIELRLLQEAKELRNKFYDNCKRYIYAHNYAKTAELLLKNDCCRMISTDQRGWKGYRFNLNEFVSVFVSTNFAYGPSSYFFCNLSYKSIDILPYSTIVKYLRIGWMDITRYTRQYEVCRDSWKYVFEFVVNAANMAKFTPDLFVETYITREIKTMMEGLRRIMENPKEILEQMLMEKLWETPIGHYNRVFNCSNADRDDYAVAPEEKIIAFKMEKTSHSLLFLDNLRKIKDIIPMVENYINEIIQMNVSNLPEIKKHITYVEEDIAKLESELDKSKAELNKVNAKLELFSEDYSKWGELTNEYTTFKISGPEFESKLRQSLSQNFLYIVENIWAPLVFKTEDLQKLIEKRNNFMKQLKDYENIIIVNVYAA